MISSSAGFEAWALTRSTCKSRRTHASSGLQEHWAWGWPLPRGTWPRGTQPPGTHAPRPARPPHHGEQGVRMAPHGEIKRSLSALFVFT